MIKWNKTQGRMMAKRYRRAAKYLDTGASAHMWFCCGVIIRTTYSDDSLLQGLVTDTFYRLYLREAPLRKAYWFGDRTPANQRRRVIALLLAAEYVENNNSIEVLSNL